MIKLGDKVKDSILGIVGTATARTEYMYGCSRICIEYIEKKSGEPKEIWLDEQRVDTKSKVKTGGFHSAPSKRSVPNG